MAEKYANNRAYAYRRTSSEHQDTYLSPQRQSRLEEAYTRKEGLVIVEVFTDIGSGLDTSSRTNFLIMIDKAMDPENDVPHILVSDLSRLTREKTPQVWIETLMDHGITLHSTTEGKSSEDFWDSLFIHNNKFSRKISRECIDGQNESVLMGNDISPIVAYGYQKYKKVIEGRPRPKWRRNRETATIVLLIFQMKADGSSTMAIVEYLNDQGFPSPRGRLWTTNTVLNILRNKVYLGYSTVGKTSRSKFPRHRRNRELVECPNAHPAIVTQDLFNRANEQIKANTRTETHSPRAPSSPNPLSERIKCGQCGANMIVINQGNNKSLICATKKKSGVSQCTKKDKHLFPLLEQIKMELYLRILTDETVHGQIGRVQDEFRDELTNEKKRQTKIAAQVGKIEQQRSRLTKTIAEFEGDYPGAIADLMKEISNLRDQQENLEKERIEINEETKERMVFLTDPDSILRTATELRTYLQSDDNEATRQMLRYFINRVDLHDDFGTINYSLPLPDTDPKDGQNTSTIIFGEQNILSKHSDPSP